MQVNTAREMGIESIDEGNRGTRLWHLSS